MKTEVETTAYLVVQGDRLKHGRVDPETGLKPLDGARVVRALRNRPEGLTADQVAVRVRLVLPTAIFDPPAAVALATKSSSSRSVKPLPSAACAVNFLATIHREA